MLVPSVAGARSRGGKEEAPQPPTCDGEVMRFRFSITRLVVDFLVKPAIHKRLDVVICRYDEGAVREQLSVYERGEK